MTLRWNGKIAKVKIRALCIGTTDQLMFFGVQKGKRLGARAVRINTHGSTNTFVVAVIVATVMAVVVVAAAAPDIAWQNYSNKIVAELCVHDSLFSPLLLLFSAACHCGCSYFDKFID